MLAAQSGQRRWCGAEHRHVRCRRGRLEPPHDFRGGLHRIRKRWPADDRIDHRDRRWIPHGTAIHELAFEKGAVVLTTGEADAVVLGIQGLDDRFAESLTAAGATGHLREQLKCPLGGAEVRDSKSDVSGDHADEGDARKVMALRNHLRSHEHVELAVRESREK